MYTAICSPRKENLVGYFPGSQNNMTHSFRYCTAFFSLFRPPSLSVFRNDLNIVKQSTRLWRMCVSVCGRGKIWLWFKMKFFLLVREQKIKNRIAVFWENIDAAASICRFCCTIEPKLCFALLYQSVAKCSFFFSFCMRSRFVFRFVVSFFSALSVQRNFTLFYFEQTIFLPIRFVCDNLICENLKKQTQR